MSSILPESFQAGGLDTISESIHALTQRLPDWLVELLSSKTAVVVTTSAAAVFSWFFISYHTSPLKQYPGPYIAGKTMF
jgi:hypothetical protein